MLGALGFTKMVFGSLLLENNFVALFGVLIRVLLAVDLGYTFASTASLMQTYSR